MQTTGLTNKVAKSGAFSLSRQAATPEQVAAFHPSVAVQDRAAALVERERLSQLTPEEASELAHFIELGHILHMAKARARMILAGIA